MAAEQLAAGTEQPRYMARLHLSEADPENGGMAYRTLQMPNLDHPHLEAVQAATILDPAKEKVYRSLAEVPGLIVLDFPAVAHPSTITPDWLSHEKLKLYRHALELGEDGEARKILADWPDAHMRSTHFFAPQDADAPLAIMNANKLCASSKPTVESFGPASWAVFTIGPGRKNLTPAISAAIAVAAKLELLPAAPPLIEPHVDLRRIALFQLAVAAGDLPNNPHYLLSGFGTDGTPITPAEGHKTEARESSKKHTREPIDPKEAALLHEQGFSTKKDGPLSREATSALLRIRVKARFPDMSELLIPYPVPETRSSQEIKDAQAATTKRLLDLPTTRGQ